MPIVISCLTTTVFRDLSCEGNVWRIQLCLIEELRRHLLTPGHRLSWRLILYESKYLYLIVINYWSKELLLIVRTITHWKIVPINRGNITQIKYDFIVQYITAQEILFILIYVFRLIFLLNLLHLHTLRFLEYGPLNCSNSPWVVIAESHLLLTVLRLATYFNILKPKLV
jgi:hypothetical protein